MIRYKRYCWYIPFWRRLYGAFIFYEHDSKAYRGELKGKPKWSRWRKAPARIWAVIDVFISQPEYWLFGHFNLSYPTTARIMRLWHWSGRLYARILGFSEEE